MSDWSPFYPFNINCIVFLACTLLLYTNTQTKIIFPVRWWIGFLLGVIFLCLAHVLLKHKLLYKCFVGVSNWRGKEGCSSATITKPFNLSKRVRVCTPTQVLKVNFLKDISHGALNRIIISCLYVYIESHSDPF